MIDSIKKHPLVVSVMVIIFIVIPILFLWAVYSIGGNPSNNNVYEYHPTSHSEGWYNLS